MLKGLLKKPVEEGVTVPYWRASEAGRCETYLVRSRLGHGAYVPTRIQYMLEDGRYHERTVLAALRQVGCALRFVSDDDGQIEVKCSDSPRIIGHPDGLVRIESTDDFDRIGANFSSGGWLLLEITGVSPFVFQRLRMSGLADVIPTKYAQIQCYLHSELRNEGVNSCVFVAKDKASWNVYEEGVGVDDVCFESVRQKLYRCEEFLGEGIVPEYRCSGSEATLCKYRKLCFDEVTFPSRTSETLDVESLSDELRGELSNALRMWKRYKNIRDESDEVVEECREYVFNLLRVNGAMSLKYEGVVAAIRHRNNVSIDREILKLYPEVYEKVVRLSESEYVTLKEVL